MMHKLKMIASGGLALVLAFIATTSADSFKWVVLYEPEVPEDLRRDNNE